MHLHNFQKKKIPLVWAEKKNMERNELSISHFQRVALRFCFYINYIIHIHQTTTTKKERSQRKNKKKNQLNLNSEVFSLPFCTHLLQYICGKSRNIFVYRGRTNNNKAKDQNQKTSVNSKVENREWSRVRENEEIRVAEAE